MKTCTKCDATKPLEEFHRQKGGKFGRHSQCRSCSRIRWMAKKKATPAMRRKWNLSRRYGMTVAEFDEIFLEQGKLCAICRKKPTRICVDHCHETGKFRGILCHRCNIFMAAIDDAEFFERAMNYKNGTKTKRSDR